MERQASATAEVGSRLEIMARLMSASNPVPRIRGIIPRIGKPVNFSSSSEVLTLSLINSNKNALKIPKNKPTTPPKARFNAGLGLNGLLGSKAASTIETLFLPKPLLISNSLERSNKAS